MNLSSRQTVLKIFTLYQQARRLYVTQNISRVQNLNWKPSTHINIWSIHKYYQLFTNCKFFTNTRGELHKLQPKAEVTLRQARVLTKTKTIKTKDNNPIMGGTRTMPSPMARVCTSRRNPIWNRSLPWMLCGAIYIVQRPSTLKTS